ncbi:MAG TPA: DUF4178 domain-containing protein [Longimicrobium sp.]|nr:DUF4178 domain-containing protein [Longimicrobium sp.]
MQTTCAHCSSILVRRDLDLERVGRVSEPPPVTSRIQLGTAGAWRGKAFTVVGRIAYRYGRGAWSEWHLAFGDGSSGWLSDAQDQYAVTFISPTRDTLPAEEGLRPEAALRVDGVAYSVTTITRAHYAGVEGELPFEYWDREEVTFADLVGEDGSFATLDYSDPEPLLFTGEHVAFADLSLRELRPADEAGQARVEGVQTLNCPSCGGTVTLQRPGEAVTAVCEFCLSVLDATTPALTVVQSFADQARVTTLIPLGSKGRLHGAEWTVLGFQQRTIRVEGVDYSWREYLLHSGELGFRYLSEYGYHWNDIVTLKMPPRRTGRGKHRKALLGDVPFRHFQHAVASTTFVLGEFPWEVRVGDKAEVDDYVDPPRLLSRERSAGEVTWSLGEYTPPETIWAAFQLKGKPPAPRGVFANQPSPHRERTRAYWATAALLGALFVALAVVRWSGGHSRMVAQGEGFFDPADTLSASFVSEPFRVEGRPSSLEVKLFTNLDNQWAWFGMVLMDVETGRVREFSRNVSYYHGVDGGESWAEGSPRALARVAAVPAGTYRLRIDPDGEAPVRFSVEVRRDVPRGWWWLVAFVLLGLPVLWGYATQADFERKRWAESDHAPADDDDDE